LKTVFGPLGYSNPITARPLPENSHFYPGLLTPDRRVARSGDAARTRACATASAVTVFCEIQ
jgi:hypothetical protein